MSFKRTKSMVADRRATAEKRQEAYDALTLEQKFAKLPPEPHAARQRAKLLKQLAEKTAPKPEPQKESKKLNPSEFVKKAREAGQDMLGFVNKEKNIARRVASAHTNVAETLSVEEVELSFRKQKKSKKGNK